jgi:hypothetical protein
MKIRVLTALLVAAGLFRLAHAADPPPAASSQAPTTALSGRAALKVVHGATFTVPNVAGVPGEKKTLTATLREESPGNPPLAGKTTSFRVSGNGMTPVELKASETDAQGKTTASFTIPDLAQGSYDIRAAWKGDAEHKAATGEGKLTVIKAPTKVEMDFTFSTYKNEPGPPSGSVTATVRRTHDNALLKKPVRVTVNGNSWTLSTLEFHSFPLPSSVGTWVVKVQFEGDAAYAASALEKTFHKPKS